MTAQRIWPATNGPASSSFDSAVNLAVEFYTSVTAWATHGHYYRGTTGQEDPATIQVWRVDSSTTGTLLGSQSVPSAGAVTGWQTITFSTAVALVANQRYRMTQYFSNNTGSQKYSATAPDFASDIVNGFLTCPSTANSTGTAQGSYTAGTTAQFPINTFNQSNYWVDVTVTDVNPVAPSNPWPRIGRPILRRSLRG